MFCWLALTNVASFAPVAGLRWSQLYSYCSYEPDASQQAPYDPRHEFRSYDCIYPLWQVRQEGVAGRPRAAQNPASLWHCERSSAVMQLVQLQLPLWWYMLCG